MSLILCGGYLDNGMEGEETHQPLCRKWAKVQDEVFSLGRRVQVEKQ